MDVVARISVERSVKRSLASTLLSTRESRWDPLDLSRLRQHFAEWQGIPSPPLTVEKSRLVGLECGPQFRPLLPALVEDARKLDPLLEVCHLTEVAEGSSPILSAIGLAEDEREVHVEL